MNLYEIFEANALGAYWTDVNANMADKMIGSTLFPVAKRTGLDLSWIKGRNGLPVALQPSAFDAKAPLRDRIGVKKDETEMPFFREAMRIGEKDRQNIETLLAKGEAFAQPTIMRIFDDVKALVDGALIQPERMIMQLLYSGRISVSANAENGFPIAYDYNYDTDGSWAAENKVELLTTAKWTAANAATSTPITDLLNAKTLLAEKKGVNATRVIMNTATFKGLMASDSIRKAMNPLGYANIITSAADDRKFVEGKTEMTIILYDKMFKDENGVDKKFYPDGYVTLLPAYTLGNTWFGTTPEEFDLLGGTTSEAASVSIVNTGIAITTIKEPHPVNVKTIVSEIVLPSFERMNDIFVIKVY
jgi:hypothetical protein